MTDGPYVRIRGGRGRVFMLTVDPMEEAAEIHNELPECRNTVSWSSASCGSGNVSAAFNWRAALRQSPA